MVAPINKIFYHLAMPMQKLAYSEHQGKMCDSSNGIGGEVIFDVNMELVTCSVSSIHEEGELVVSLLSRGPLFITSIILKLFV